MQKKKQPAEELGPARNKRPVRLSPGFSQLDWARLAQSSSSIGGSSSGTKQFSWPEIKEHNNVGHDFWIVVHGKVYNLTKYLPYHPGGVAILARFAGDDATTAFDEYHPWVSLSMIDKCQIGVLAGQSRPSPAPRGQSAPLQPRQPLSPSTRGGRGGLTILGRLGLGRKVSSPKGAAQAPTAARGADEAAPDLDTPATTAGLPLAPQAASSTQPQWFKAKLLSSSAHQRTRFCYLVRVACSKRIPQEQFEELSQPGSFVKLRVKINGAVIERAFTPFLAARTAEDHAALLTPAALNLSTPPDRCVDLFVKAYCDGTMTKFLARASPGSSMEIQLCSASCQFSRDDQGLLTQTISGSAGFRKAVGSGMQHICLIAAGTGIMPMLQLLDFVALAKARMEPTSSWPTFSLMVASRSQSDIPMPEVLEAFEESGILRRKTVILSKPGDAQAQGIETGHLSGSLVTKHLSEVYVRSAEEESLRAPGIRFLICGSFEFNMAAEAALLQQGWPGSAIYRFE